jgi:hypothetical protein
VPSRSGIYPNDRPTASIDSAFSTEKPHQITSKVKKDTRTFRRWLRALILKEAFYGASNNHVFLMPNSLIFLIGVEKRDPSYGPASPRYPLERT